MTCPKKSTLSFFLNHPSHTQNPFSCFDKLMVVPNDVFFGNGGSSPVEKRRNNQKIKLLSTLLA
jgi:hypothetical protein